MQQLLFITRVGSQQRLNAASQCKLNGRKQARLARAILAMDK